MRRVRELLQSTSSTHDVSAIAGGVIYTYAVRKIAENDSSLPKDSSQPSKSSKLNKAENVD